MTDPTIAWGFRLHKSPIVSPGEGATWDTCPPHPVTPPCDDDEDQSGRSRLTEFHMLTLAASRVVMLIWVGAVMFSLSSMMFGNLARRWMYRFCTWRSTLGIVWGGEKVAGSISTLIQGKRGRERESISVFRMRQSKPLVPSIWCLSQGKLNMPPVCTGNV